jgi:hypothetical protein
MPEYVKKGKNWITAWTIVWALMFVLVIWAYPSSPSVWFGWLPSSVVILFGLMVITFVLAMLFCRQRFRA